MDFEEYLRELRSPSSRLKVASLARLSGMRPEQARSFEEAWPSIDVRRRRRIVQELTDLAEDNVDINFDPVFLCGLKDPDSVVRLESVRGLWEYDGADIIAPLLRLLEEDEDAAVRAEAALSLGKYALLAEYGRLRDRYTREVEAGLHRVLSKDNEVEEVRARTLEAIGPRNSAWVRQAIREAYESDRRRLKVSAVHAMGRSCEERWLPLLFRELSNEEPEIRYEAAVACGSLGDERAVSHLIRLTHDPDEEVREASVAALGEIGGPQAKNALQELAADPSAAMREAAAEALSHIHFEEDPLAFRYRP